MSPEDRLARPRVLWKWPAGRAADWLFAAGAATSFGLTLCRALAEGLSADGRGLAAPLGTLLLTGVLVALALFLWRRVGRRAGRRPTATVFAPLFLSLGYLFSDGVNLRRAMIWLSGSLLLAGMSWATAVWPSKPRKDVGRPARWAPVALLVAITMAVYLATMGTAVGEADTFEFQVVAYRLGIAHPTGYPLYVLLGRLFTLLPFSSVAWRVNLLSAVCASMAAAFAFGTMRRLYSISMDGLALLGALALAFSPTLWSQAVEAEVYALNSLFVAVIIWLLATLFRGGEPGRLVPALFLVFGLGLTNHVTMLLLLPAVVLGLWLCRPQLSWKRWLGAACLFGLGLSVYLYLPARWPALHDGVPMTMSQFAGWVTGSQFRGALQLGAWRADPTRYGIVARLVLDQWGWAGVTLAAAGLVWLARQRWRFALVTLVAWLAYAFYALSYYVPDVSVFLIPAHLIQAIWIGLGAMALTQLAGRVVERGAAGDWRHFVPAAAGLFALLPLFLLTRTWSLVDHSERNPLEKWGRRVLALGLETGAAILADSEKIAPLYYLQVTEGRRPDLEIMVLPDESAYRSELDARVAGGQTVYLARFLPHLEGIYFLRSAGPLTEVSPTPLLELPPLDSRLDARFGGDVTLLGYTLDPIRPAYPDAVHLTLYWTVDAPQDSAYHVRLRLVDGDGVVVWESDGSHPVDNSYPTSAWRPGAIVPDWHEIAWPLHLAPADYQLEVALMLPYSDDGQVAGSGNDPWLTVATLEGRAPREIPAPKLARRIWAVGGVVTGLDVTSSMRPGAASPVTLFFDGDPGTQEPIEIGWDAEGSMMEAELTAPITTVMLSAPSDNGSHELFMSAERPLRCGWLARLAASCPLAQVDALGAPLPLGAVNYQDLFALLSTETAGYELQPGGTLDVTLTWRVLAPIDDDYTVFVHVLDEADQIVGQVDAWPVQGTYPTSQMLAGEVVTDPYRIAVVPDAAPGAYRIEIGWYLLGTMRRLDVLAPGGEPVDNRVLVEGFFVR